MATASDEPITADVSNASAPGHWPTMHIEHATASRSVKGEDTITVAPLNDEGKLPSRDVLYVLCDGHVGNHASRFVAVNAGQVLKKRLPTRVPDANNASDMEAYAGEVRKALVDTFVALDNGLLARLQDKVRSGTTMTMVVVTGPLVSVANVGDSDAVLDTGSRRIEMSCSHRITSNESEMARLRGAGLRIAPLGFDLKGPSNGSEPGVGPARLWPGGLSVSRVMGDFESGRSIAPMPHIKQVHLMDGGCRIIIASDGLWDCVSQRKAAATVRPMPIFSAATELVRVAARNQRVTDDTSVIVVDILCEGNHHFPEMAMQAREALKHTKSMVSFATDSTSGRGSLCSCFGGPDQGAPSLEANASKTWVTNQIDMSRHDGPVAAPDVVVVADVDTLATYPSAVDDLQRPQLGVRPKFPAGKALNISPPDSPRTNDTAIDCPDMGDFSTGSTRSRRSVQHGASTMEVVSENGVINTQAVATAAATAM